MNSVSEYGILKICVIGNSHAGSLKLGWELIKQNYPNIKMSFFAAKAGRLEGLLVQDGKLIPANGGLKKSLSHTSGGYGEIDLSLFDVCLIYGLKLSFPSKLEMSRMNNCLSKAAYECAFYDTFINTLSVKTLKKIRSLSDIPVYIGHNPLLAFNKNQFLGGPSSYANFIAKANAILVGDQAILLEQPSQTITQNIYTLPKYKSGAVSLEIGAKSDNQLYGDQNNAHMNDIFGRIYLEDFFTALCSKCTKPDRLGF